jgi:hypothetical protein
MALTSLLCNADDDVFTVKQELNISMGGPEFLNAFQYLRSSVSENELYLLYF